MKIPAWVWGVIFVLLQLADVGANSVGGVATIAHLAGVVVGAAAIRMAAWGRPAPEMLPRTFRFSWARP